MDRTALLAVTTDRGDGDCFIGLKSVSVSVSAGDRSFDFSVPDPDEKFPGMWVPAYISVPDLQPLDIALFHPALREIPILRETIGNSKSFEAPVCEDPQDFLKLDEDLVELRNRTAFGRRLNPSDSFPQLSLLESEYSSSNYMHYATIMAYNRRPEIFLELYERALQLDAIYNCLQSIRLFKENVGAFLSFREKLSTIYATNLRTLHDGSKDSAKSQQEIERYLKREAIHYDAGWLTLIVESAPSLASPVLTSGTAYEREVSDRLKGLGYKVSETKGSGDFGADLIADKDELKYAIQVKRHAKPVGVSAVQEAAGSRRYYKCDYAVVVSHMGFTPAARDLALDNDVILVDDQRLDRIEAIALAALRRA